MPAVKHDDLLLRLVKDVNDIKAALRRTVANLPLYDIANENTPAQITVDQNNYSPGNYDVLRLSSNAAVNITGMTGGVKGRSLTLFNDGSYPIVLKHNSLLSSAQNRFRFSSAFDAMLLPQANLRIYYDTSSSRWIDADRMSAGAIYCEVSKNTVQGTTHGIWTKLNTGTVSVDQFDFYDSIGNIYTMRFSGVYIINFTVNWSGPGAETPVTCDLAIYVNGSLTYQHTLSDISGGALTQQAAFLIVSDLGDQLEFYVRQISVPAGGDNIDSWRISLARV